MSGIVEHLEHYLGPVDAGWSRDADGRRMPFQLALFHDSPIKGAWVLATVGLSSVQLRVGQTEKRLRQELMFMFRGSEGPRNLPGVLQQVALEALARDQAYAVGDVLGPRGELRTGSILEALYVSAPVYLPDAFHVLRPEGGDPIVIGWLVPVSASEAAFLRARGGSRFEDELERSDPDLLDFERDAIV